MVLLEFDYVKEMLLSVFLLVCLYSRLNALIVSHFG